MNLGELCAALPETVGEEPAFPERMLGAFRRKSVTFCNGMTDERTVVHWFQSRGFTIDLRLPDGAETPVALRQGWVGDTLWDAASAQMSWRVTRGYQLHEQWPEPAEFRFIGNSVLEFAPSGAYVEDWRQLATRGPLLGMRLLEMRDEAGAVLPMEGGLIVAGEHVAFACSRLPAVDAALAGRDDLAEALAAGVVSEIEAESCEVSIALGGGTVVWSTTRGRIGQPIIAGDFAVEADGTVVFRQSGREGHTRELHFAVDFVRREMVFARETPASAEAIDWLAREQVHLARHATVAQ